MEPYAPAFDPSADVKREKHQIRLLGTLSGGAILLYVLLQNLLVGLMMVLGLYETYRSEPLFQAGADLLLVLVCLLLPFLLLGKPMARISGTQNPLPLDGPRSKLDFALAIPVGVGFCLVANTVSSYIITFISGFGLELSSPELPLPQGVLGVTASFFRVVVVAAMVEELCFRGVVMGNLRRYGDFFAVSMASLVFALMHCNLIQAPFALIVGFALGYLSIYTGTLWTGILIHAVNNTVSLAFSYLLEEIEQNAAALLYTALTDLLLAAGAICFLVLLLRRRKRPQPPSVRTACTFGQKLGAFLLNPAMPVALAMIVWFTLQFVQKAG